MYFNVSTAVYRSSLVLFAAVLFCFIASDHRYRVVVAPDYVETLNGQRLPVRQAPPVPPPEVRHPDREEHRWEVEEANRLARIQRQEDEENQQLAWERAQQRRLEWEARQRQLAWEEEQRQQRIQELEAEEQSIRQQASRRRVSGQSQGDMRTRRVVSSSSRQPFAYSDTTKPRPTVEFEDASYDAEDAWERHREKLEEDEQKRRLRDRFGGR